MDFAVQVLQLTETIKGHYSLVNQPDESDFMAGGQTAYALTAFCRYKNNMKNLFNLRPEKASLLSKNGSAMPVMVIAVVIAVIAAAVVLMLKRRNKKE